VASVSLTRDRQVSLAVAEAGGYRQTQPEK